MEQLRAEDDLQVGTHLQLWLTVAEPIGVGGEVTFTDFAADSGDVAQLELDLTTTP